MPPPPLPPPPPYCALRPKYVVTGRKDDDHGRNGRDPPLFEAEVKMGCGWDADVTGCHAMGRAVAWEGNGMWGFRICVVDWMARDGGGDDGVR